MLALTPFWLQKRADLRAHDLAHSLDMWRRSRLANVTCLWSWRLSGINFANFTERNSYPTSSLDLAPHTVHVMYAKTLTDKPPELHTRITLMFSNPLEHIPRNVHCISFIHFTALML